MSRIKNIAFLLVILALAGCMPGKTAKKYLPTISASRTFVNGGWIIAELQDEHGMASGNVVEGELIAFQDHQLYILDPDKMHVLPDTRIYSATLYLYKKQPEIFVILTIIGIIPNVVAVITVPGYAGVFLVLGIIPLVSGSIFTAVEAGSKKNQLRYPEKNSLQEFVKFSRFPQGIPPGQDLSRLKLPETK